MTWKKLLKKIGWSILGLILVLVTGISLFLYDIGEGFDSFEDTPPELPSDLGERSVLIFSKTNGFRHGEAIDASLLVYQNLANSNNWLLYETDNGAVFNDEHLAKFKVVVWNNVTGIALLPEQRAALRRYIENGGGFLAVHGAGDHSHKWEWYEENVIRARFSHHNIGAELETASMSLQVDTTNRVLAKGLERELKHKDEWYVFYDNPRENGCTVLYTVDENTFDTSGNLSFLVTDKDFGMGEDHPIVWYHELLGGRVYYSALGHHAAAFESKNYQQLLSNAITWVGRFDQD